ncbi:MAG: hypothetical protein N2486_02015 [Caloramator sp.]|nr:hypothetical protein [Caloramator sp.]
MLNFVIGMMLGAIFGLFMFSIFSVSSDSDKKAEKMISDWVEYKCKVNTISECGNLCCWYCLGASECKFVCKGHPSECGQSIAQLK